ncbi:MAG: class II aldolase/adducin family protein [Candidatus Nanopelagicales bacterium]
MNEAQARALLVQAGHRLLAEGLVARTWGNLSVRLDEHTMAITPSGIAYPDLTEKMIVLVDLETYEWSGPYKPSGERKVHQEVYRRRPDVLAGVHTHQVAASICAAARVPVPTPTLGEVPCAPYGLPGTKRLTEATLDALGAGPAVLMANHGVLTVGADLESAFDRVTELERACADYVVVKRPYEGSHMPADPDAPWDPRCLSEVPLADGSVGWLSEAPFTVRFSVLRKALPPVLDDLAQLTGRHVAPVRSTPRRRPRRDAVLIPGRGALVFGSDHEAVAMVIEKAARAWIGAAGIGGAKPLPVWEALLMRVVYARSYSKQAAAAHPAP